MKICEGGLAVSLYVIFFFVARYLSDLSHSPYDKIVTLTAISHDYKAMRGLIE